LAEVTGGMAYFPETLDEVKPVASRSPADIRNQYTIAYYPTNAEKDGTFPSVQVQLVSYSGTRQVVCATAHRATTRR